MLLPPCSGSSAFWWKVTDWLESERSLVMESRVSEGGDAPPECIPYFTEDYCHGKYRQSFHVLLAATISEGGNLLHCISRTNILGQ